MKMNFTIKKIKCNTVEYIDLNVHIRDDEFMIVDLSLLKTSFNKIKILSNPYSEVKVNLNEIHDLLLRDSDYPVYIRHAGGIIIEEITVVFDDISDEEYTIAEKYIIVDGLSSISQSFDKAWIDVNNAVEYVNKHANFSNIAIKYYFSGDDRLITSITERLDIDKLTNSDNSDYEDFDLREYTCHIIVGNETKRKFKVFIPDEPNKITVECIDYLDHSETKRVITSDKLKVIVGSDLIAISTTYRAVHNAPMKY